MLRSVKRGVGWVSLVCLREVSSRIIRMIALSKHTVERLIRRIIQDRMEFQHPRAHIEIETPLLRVKGN
jgi:hypothetical protein